MHPSFVSSSVVDGIAVLLVDSPPVNAIGAEVRAALWEALSVAESDPAVRGVAIGAAGTMFSGGGDLREIGRLDSQATISLTRLNLRIERFGKPVVIALHGRCIGGAVLLAMACHGRVALADARLMLPELNLALIPGAGGTQRLPRLVGLRAALDVVVPAQAIDAARAEAIGLVDAVLPGDLLAHARRRALAIAAGQLPWRRTADLAVPPIDAAAADALRREYAELAHRHFPGREAPAVAIDLILAAAGIDAAQGFERERLAYLRLAGAPQAQALLHLFFSERKLAKRAEMADGVARQRIAQRLGAAGRAWSHTLAGAAGQPSPMDERLLQAFVDEAQACLDDRLAACASDIDVIAVRDCGFPALLGGPLHYASTR